MVQNAVNSDTESQAVAAASEEKATHRRRMEVLGLLFENAEQLVTDYPGLLAWCRHLEQQYASLVHQADFGLINRQLPAQLSLNERCWLWYGELIKAWRRLGQGLASGPRINELLNGLQILGIDEQAWPLVSQAIVSTLCLLSATLTPTEPDTRPLEEVKSPSYWLKAKYGQTECSWKCASKLPSKHIFLGFRADHDSIHAEDPGYDLGVDSFDDSLNVRVMEYKNLLINGHLRIEWVSSLAHHLVVDSNTCTLSIFKFPSLCAATVRNSGNSTNLGVSVARWVMEQSRNNNKSYRQADCLGIFREVLLSYRLLFWQWDSHRLLVKALAQLGEEETDTLLRELTDPLPVIASKPWVPVSVAQKEYIQMGLFPRPVQVCDMELWSWNVFSADEVFPVYGRRLQTIHHRVKTQMPQPRPRSYLELAVYIVGVIGAAAGIVSAVSGLLGLSGEKSSPTKRAPRE
ncbi:hypothetical protein BDV18DRAFT_162491 [Aspergillus unguis]